uniref:Zinc finger FYVE domain containing protein 9 n=1 Tax=Echinococcus granulosus TaxID=6210 RepID=A0A068WML3_ECHGR|nr:zinc finger FYVE domain containing protein 9 [Echinococcus granulosus]
MLREPGSALSALKDPLSNALLSTKQNQMLTVIILSSMLTSSIPNHEPNSIKVISRKLGSLGQKIPVEPTGKCEAPFKKSRSANRKIAPQPKEYSHANLMNLNIPVEDSNTAELGTSVDLERRTFTLEDATFSHILSIDPNSSMNQPKESSHCPRSSVPKDLRISGTETEIVQGTVSETVCDSSPPAEVVNVNEGFFHNLFPFTMESLGEPPRAPVDPQNTALYLSSVVQSSTSTVGTTVEVPGALPHENGDESAIAVSNERHRTSPSLPSTSSSVRPQSIPPSLNPPEWAADTSSTVCVACNSRFTMMRRRHHCRTCGRLLCATCTPHRVPLPPSFSHSSAYSSPEGSLLRLVSGSIATSDGSNKARLHRVCIQCFHQMFGSPPAQACSPPTITVESSPAAMSASQTQVPPLESLAEAESVAPQTIPQRRPLPPSLVVSRLKDDCLIPSASSKSSWPPLVIATTPELVLESQPSDDRVRDLLATDGGMVTFAVTRNLHVLVSIVSGDIWSFISHGLYTVGQEEVCLLLRQREGETIPPIDALVQYFLLYDLAFSPWCSDFRTPMRPTTTNNTAFVPPLDEGFCLLLPNPFTGQQQRQQQLSSSTWFDGACCDFLYVHASPPHAESLTDLLCLLPTPPFLIALILRHPNEVTWATRHPLRLLLTLSRACNDAFPLISDRDRSPAFSNNDAAASSVLSLCDGGSGSGAVCCFHVPELNILVSGLGGRGELRLQLLLRRSAHEHVRRALRSVGHEESLLFGLTGNFCPTADCHLAVSDSAAGLTTELTPHDSADPSKTVVGASFVLIEGVGGCNSSLSVVEDGCVARLTTEQFKALLTHMRNASPLQLRIETAQGLSTTSSFNGGIITVNWIDEPALIHFTSLHCSWVDGRLVEPRCTFVIPREQQLRHWLMRQGLSDDGNDDVVVDVGPRIAWTRLHNLASRPVYAVDNRSGEVLDLFAVFNAVAATSVNALFPYSRQLRKANHRSISLRILLQPPNTFNFFIGSNSSPGSGHRRTKSLIPSPKNSNWWKVVSNAEGEASSSPGPLISDPGYVNGLDSALIPLLDGLVHNISCSWFFDSTSDSKLVIQCAEDPLTAPGLLLEFDFDLLD